MAQGQASDIWNETREVLRVRKYMVDTLSKATGQSPEKLNDELMRNRYFEARDAKEYGIIDQVIRPQSPAPESLDKISKVLFEKYLDDQGKQPLEERPDYMKSST